MKKTAVLHHANPTLLPPPRSRAGSAYAQPQRAAELEERWNFVDAKENARWRWQALDHPTGRVLSYVVGARKDAEFLKLRALLAPFGITRSYTDKARVYQRPLPPAQHTVGKLLM